MPPKKFQTNVSQAFWCEPSAYEVSYKPAKFLLHENMGEGPVSWFDELFEGGLLCPEVSEKPLTVLVAGPPGSGKTTLAMELCYRLARDENKTNNENLFSVYISTEQAASQLIENTISFGYKNADKHVVDFREEPDKPSKYDNGRVAVFGKDKIEEYLKKRKGEERALLLSDIVEGALQSLNYILVNSALPVQVLDKLFRQKILQKLTNEGDGKEQITKARPDILVIDSLNTISEDEQHHFFEQFHSATSSGCRMVIFVLDSASPGAAHEAWEFASDVVIRLDHRSINDYYIRSIEVKKARYQSHIWGSHQLKIYKNPTLDTSNAQSSYEILRRNHPYRQEGGIFIYPSIHYYLSLYKRRGPEDPPEFATTMPRLTGVLDEGIPEGRCTAFIGTRGGHKSHFGYLHLLHRIINKPEGKEEAALVISLRDDEKMTWRTMDKIRTTEFSYSGITLNELQQQDKLEILYFHPGYITPEEFFHRIFISLQRLKKTGRKLTVLFNSLDQLRSRFPLCAKQEIFIPSIIECLSGEGITSIMIAVDEKGQPAEQYGLLPMADLILSFYPHEFKSVDYHKHLMEARKHTENSQVAKKRGVEKIRTEYKTGTIEAVLLRVVRFAGGQQAGARGILELVDENNLGLYDSPGLKFTKLSPKYSFGSPVHSTLGD